MLKWPQVPDCRGWLGLDTRGRWWMRDDRCQAAGAFPASRGSEIRHERLLEFIGRNYMADSAGEWYFQNGPQRVFVELEVAPYVWRLHRLASGSLDIRSHTDVPAGLPLAVLLDEAGRLFLQTELGFGLVHSLDMEAAADEIEARRWQTAFCPADALSERFGFVLSPAARA
jgi:hypothetical protein